MMTSATAAAGESRGQGLPADGAKPGNGPAREAGSALATNFDRLGDELWKAAQAQLRRVDTREVAYSTQSHARSAMAVCSQFHRPWAFPSPEQLSTVSTQFARKHKHPDAGARIAASLQAYEGPDPKLHLLALVRDAVPQLNSPNQEVRHDAKATIALALAVADSQPDVAGQTAAENALPEDPLNQARFRLRGEIAAIPANSKPAALKAWQVHQNLAPGWHAPSDIQLKTFLTARADASPKKKKKKNTASDRRVGESMQSQGGGDDFKVHLLSLVAKAVSELSSPDKQTREDAASTLDIASALSTRNFAHNQPLRQAAFDARIEIVARRHEVQSKLEGAEPLARPERHRLRGDGTHLGNALRAVDLLFAPRPFKLDDELEDFLAGFVRRAPKDQAIPAAMAVDRFRQHGRNDLQVHLLSLVQQAAADIASPDAALQARARSTIDLAFGLAQSVIAKVPAEFAAPTTPLQKARLAVWQEAIELRWKTHSRPNRGFRRGIQLERDEKTRNHASRAMRAVHALGPDWAFPPDGRRDALLAEHLRRTPGKYAESAQRAVAALQAQQAPDPLHLLSFLQASIPHLEDEDTQRRRDAKATIGMVRALSKYHPDEWGEPQDVPHL